MPRRKRKVPALAKFRVNDPELISLEAGAPSSNVTLWVPPTKFQVTVAPRVTVTAVGSKVLPADPTFTVPGAGGGGGGGGGGGVDGPLLPPQAAPRITAVETKKARMFIVDPPIIVGKWCGLPVHSQ